MKFLLVLLTFVWTLIAALTCPAIGVLPVEAVFLDFPISMAIAILLSNIK